LIYLFYRIGGKFLIDVNIYFLVFLIFRIETGLIKPTDDEPLIASNSKLSSEQEKALKKKEKVIYSDILIFMVYFLIQDRKRRELKKLKPSKNILEEPKQEDKEILNRDVDSTVKKPKKTKTKKYLKNKNKEEEKLQKRITELLKGGCGGDIFLESSSSNYDGNRSKMCLDFFSGMTLLQMPKKDDEISNEIDKTFTIANNNVLSTKHIKILSKKRSLLLDIYKKYSIYSFNTLIFKSDLDNMILCHGQISFVCAVDPYNSSPDSESTETLALGIEAKSFDATVSRGKWTHIALVASEKPQNRVTLYLVIKLLLFFSENILFYFM
jgi:hypothetical protein